MRKALKHHHTSIADVDPIWNDYMQGFETYNRDMIDLRFELKQHVTREQWKAIFPQN